MKDSKKQCRILDTKLHTYCKCGESGSIGKVVVDESSH